MRTPKFYYVYIITNLILNKQYVGSRLCYKDKIEDDIYWGSSRYLKKDYKTYGAENFKKEILQSNYNNIKDLLDGETQYILKYNTLEPNGYNRFLPNEHYGFHGSYLHSTEHNEKIRKSLKGIPKTKEHAEKVGLAQRGKKRKPLSDEHKLKISIGEKGRLLSDETKEKISKSNTGKIRTDETKQKLKLARTGKKQSEETKEKKRKANTGKIRTEETKQKMRKSKSKEHKLNIRKNHFRNKLKNRIIL